MNEKIKNDDLNQLEWLKTINSLAIELINTSE